MRIGLILAFFTLIIDQLSKFIIVKDLSTLKIEVTSFFNIALVYNKGISFGLFNKLAYSNYLFCFLSSAIVCFLLKWLKDSKHRYESIGLGFVIGGAIGNIIDRLIYPGVVDFLEFHWNEHYWPSFNIADSAICLGVCILLIFSIDFKSKKIIS